MSRERPSPLGQLFLVRVRVFLREPADVFWTFGVPLLVAIALGVAFRVRGVEPVAVAIERTDPATTERVAAALAAEPGLTATVHAPAEVDAALRTGRVALAVRPGDPVRFRFDPTRPESRLARLAVAAALDRAAARAPAYRATDEPITERGARYIDYLIPGLIGMTLLSISLWGLATPIVDARARKQLKRLAATPMRRRDYLLALLLGHGTLVIAVVAVLVGFARIAFDVRVTGSYLTLAVVTAVGALSFAGLSVLVGSRTASAQVASGLNNLIVLPLVVTSGVFFAASRFPDALQPVIRLLPLAAFNHALRQVMTEGAPLAALGAELAILAGWGLVSFAIGVRVFRWT